MVTRQADTLPGVPQTKAVPDAVRRHFAAEVRRWVADQCDGNQSEAARRLGCSQSHISALTIHERGVGLNFILLFAAETGKSVDELLGMKTGMDTAEHIRQALREELAVLRGELKGPSDAPALPAPVVRRRMLK